MKRSYLQWRRLDAPGHELLRLQRGPVWLHAIGKLACAEAGGFRLTHRWQLTTGWGVRRLRVQRRGAPGDGTLRLDRTAIGWSVDGADRPDLAAAELVDLSVTPFCNTFAIRQVPDEVGASREFDVVFVDGATLTIARSRQRYERLGPRRVRYVDLGLSRGFTAEILVDGDGLVFRYEHLFERVGDPR